jgi:hypothetical protein
LQDLCHRAGFCLNAGEVIHQNELVVTHECAQGTADGSTTHLLGHLYGVVAWLGRVCSTTADGKSVRHDHHGERYPSLFGGTSSCLCGSLLDGLVPNATRADGLPLGEYTLGASTQR